MLARGALAQGKPKRNSRSVNCCHKQCLSLDGSRHSSEKQCNAFDRRTMVGRGREELESGIFCACLELLALLELEGLNTGARRQPTSCMLVP